jgi:Cd2+/Zn2+-exporting ATPase
VLALFAVADTVKESSREAIAQLHALGINTVMLSGDNPHTAAAIAAQVGIDRAYGDQLPQDKLAAVEAKLAAEGEKVGMVGDGINDAPALARADIGFAMGAMGTDTAIETADVALMDDDLRKIPAFVRLSQAAPMPCWCKTSCWRWPSKPSFSPSPDAGARHHVDGRVRRHVGASLLVVGNGLRLLRLKTSE